MSTMAAPIIDTPPLGNIHNACRDDYQTPRFRLIQHPVFFMFYKLHLSPFYAFTCRRRVVFPLGTHDTESVFIEFHRMRARSSHGIRFQRIAEPNECQGHLPYHKHQNKSHHEHAYIKNSGHQSRSNRQHQKQPSPPKPSARKKRSRGRGGDAEYTCPYQRISVFRAEQSEALCRRARAMPRYPAPVRGNGGIALRDFLCRPSSGYSCGKNPPSLCQKCRFS